MEKHILLELIEKGLSSTKIGIQTGKSQTTISYWLKKYNLKTKYSNPKEQRINKIEDISEKLCIHCNIEKPISEFYIRRSNQYYKYCKLCSYEISKTRRYKKDLSHIDWNKIQEEHNNGLCWNKIPETFRISMSCLKGAHQQELIKKIKICKKWTKEERKIQSEGRTNFWLNNPEKHPWKKSTKFVSKPCEILKVKMRENKISFMEEFTPLIDRSFSLDIAFPDKKIGIEVNGNQHYNRNGSLKEYYQNRKELIEQDGWQLFDVHYSKIYDSNFISNFIKKIKDDYSLHEVDYSFYIKPKKEYKSKYGTAVDYWNAKRNSTLNKNKPLIDVVLNSDIDFSIFGWSGKLSKLLGIRPQKSNSWMKKYMPDFYEQKCFKKKDRHGKSRNRKYGNMATYYSKRRDNGRKLMKTRINMLINSGIDLFEDSCYRRIMEIFNLGRAQSSRILRIARKQLKNK